jgi:FkbM family methyltransferase
MKLKGKGIFILEKSYSQREQDLIVFNFFKIYPAKNKIFLDVGAFDGINYSNTRLFYENGWSGICLEACSKNYKKLEQLYLNTSIITEQVAVTDFVGEVELNVATIPWNKDWGSDVSSANDYVVDHWKEYIWTKEKVDANTLDRILDSEGIKYVDYVSIDVEGSEIQVLRGFNIKEFKPHLMVIEYSNKNHRKELLRYLKKYDYFLWMDNGGDIFVVQGSRICHLKILFKGFLSQKIKKIILKKLY